MLALTHRRLIGIVTAALLGLASGPLPDANGAPADGPEERVRTLVARQKSVREALRGTWERAGDKSAGFSAEHQRWTFEGDFVTVETKLDAKDVRKAKYRYQLNPLREPPEITLHSEDGLLQGIYKLDGDTLTLATCGISEVERPKGFTREDAGELTSKLVVLTFKRVGAKAELATQWVERAVKALVSDDRNALPVLAKEFQALPAAVRRALPVTVRGDAVEFAFRGGVTVGEHLGFVEYLIAGEDKGYEALLVAPEGELKRLGTLRPFFERHTGGDRRRRWNARLMWVEDGTPRSADLGDILGLLSAKERAEFLDGQEIDAAGYFGGESTTGKNVRCDPAVLPQKPAAAVLQLTLRREPLK